ncbi:MAG: HAD family phosphatase [Chloroflexi bacterium]|nr:HAD family phosphatase [Chloroflexota bacterium]MCI0831273.1 HAD family phosphatase [Chloroflexota bacterium]
MTVGRYRAVVFDLDGVLWDGEPLYLEAFNVVLRPLGQEVTAADYEQIIGSSVEAAWEWVIGRFELSGPPEQFYAAYDATVLDLLAQPVEPLPGARETIARLKSIPVPVGLASASLRQWVDATLAGIGLAGEFEATVSASEVKRAKPAPDMYLKAAEKLGVPASDCIAIEDTRTGVASARAAGMYVVQLRAASTALPPIEEADAVIESYAEFDFSPLGG